MATVINNPNTDSSAGGWSVAIIILAILVLGVLAFFVFGRGALSNGGTSAPTVNIPVNVGGGGADTGGSGGTGAAQ